MLRGGQAPAGAGGLHGRGFGFGPASRTQVRSLCRFA